MQSNIIVLTNGLSGSSVLTALIAKAGYWIGDETKRKEYNTYENSKLVDLNIRILKHTGFLWEKGLDIPSPSIEKLKNLSLNIDTKEFQSFITECDNNRPWLWKDPRLSYTIHFWKDLLPLKEVKIIIIERDLKQIWMGQILRSKTPISLENLGILKNESYKSSKSFVRDSGIDCLELDFESLIMYPEQTLEELNAFLESSLTLEDLKRVYKGQLFQKRWSNLDYVKAQAKFFLYKNVIRETIKFPRSTYG